MTTYRAELLFGGDPQEAEDWIKAIQAELPDTVDIKVSAVPLILDLSEVTEEHAGNRVTIRGYFDKIAKGDTAKAKEQANRLVKSQNLSGTLEHVFRSGSHAEQRTLIIDGKAYDIPAYSMVELGEW